MNPRVIAVFAAVAAGVVVTGAMAGDQGGSTPDSMTTVAQTYPLGVDPRPNECISNLSFTWGEGAAGAMSALGAVRRFYPGESDLMSNGVGNQIVLSKFEGIPPKKVAAYRVVHSGHDTAPWILSEAARSNPCGSRDPGMPEPMDRRP